MSREGAAQHAVSRLERAVRRLAERTAGQRPTGRSHDDADDTIGTAATDDALGFDPFPVLRALAEHDAPAVIIGQVAGIMHGSTELTGDLDLLWPGAAEHAPSMAAAFAAAGARLTDDNGAALECDPAAFGRPKVLFRCATAAGDCCTPELPWGDLPVAGFIDRCAVASTPWGFEIRYLALADLIAMRLAVGRPKDVRRAAELRDLTL